MSIYLSNKYKHLVPYTPGEQPQDKKYVKLNTNESPFPPSPIAMSLARQAAGDINLYSDPDCKMLLEAGESYFGVEKENLIFTNGSDEVLNFAFMAFCDENNPAVFADITYGFYSVFAEVNHIPYTEIPLKDDFTIDINDYINAKGTIFIANPNAPTGIALTLEQIEKIVSSNTSRIVVIDEAYVDFGCDSAVNLIYKYPNLLVTQTFSKSRSLAGGRLGIGIGSREIIKDLNTLRFSTNPYNINKMTMAAGVGALVDVEYFKKCTNEIIETRIATTESLKDLGFEVLDSKTNFVFAKHPNFDGGLLYKTLKEQGILVRHFTKPRLDQYNRITIGSKEQMSILVSTIKSILEDKK